MPQTSFLLAVIQHTPVWVWPLLAALLSLGVRQAFARSVTLRRSTVLPVSMLVLSLWGVASAFGSGQALAAWTVGGVAAGTWSWCAGAPRGVRWSVAEQTFRLPGSWLPLMLILGIFCMKFALAMSLAQHPQWRDASGFALGTSLTYGVFSGLFAGRAMALWRLAWQTSQVRPAGEAPRPVPQNSRP